uniref:Protein translocase subunit SecA n=1 Tax=Bostrychia simpliciuscula TaxID=324754 RepID=A0A1Z1M7T0_9FLOR|nr:preprotein-translocase subunit a [Bostrychia simpliciuscula]ARW62029.1 preprotein-translocase subunit a [Bostrychia simpliciuscula]
MFNFLYNTPIQQHKKTIKLINIFFYKLEKYSDKELKQQTSKIKSYVQNNKFKVDDIIPEALATIKEAIKREIGIVLFDVQLLGAIILHEKNIAEMKTGEGKTLVAMLPAYLNALINKSVHIVTVNDYLAERDALLAKRIFNYIGITVGLITQYTKYSDRKQEYLSDITYVTNSELGFDYLRDNMCIHKNEIVQRGFDYAIIDEVDSILIDEARTPLIISGKSEISNSLYKKAKKITDLLISQKHYKIDEKSKNIILTEKGILFCESNLNIKNLYNINSPWIKYILNALKAKELFIKNKDYILKNNKITIVDEFTGRVMEGRRWSDGLHQAIEAKENIKIESENKTLASITYQNLFLLYKKLCGMTGTAKTEENEFLKIYRLRVIEIPTNKVCIRKNLPDLVYKLEYNKWQAIAKECFDMYQIGRPTLIGTTSIEKSELLAKILDTLSVPYNLLNAKPENIIREAEIITQAGKKYSITISTNMAGRGTDIILGGNPNKIAQITITTYIKNKLSILNKNKRINKSYSDITQSILNKIDINFFKLNINIKNIEKEIDSIINSNYDRKNIEKEKISIIYEQLVKKYKISCDQEKKEILSLGGLYVIGTERHESRRIDNQLRGRCARQGDKGTSRFFLSLQDNLFRIFGGNTIESLMKKLNINDNIPIESIILSKSLNSAQRKVESYFYDIRKKLFEYDEVINNQREAIYTERKKILESTFTRDCIIEYGEYTIYEMLKIYEKENNIKKQQVLEQILQLLNISKHFKKDRLISMKLNEMKKFLYEQFRISYDLKESYLEELRPGLVRQMEKYYLLQQIDKGWQEHIEKMSLLKEYIGWRSYGQQDPIVEYKNEAFNLFINMVTYIRQTVTYLIMRSRLIINT